jgi:hypothetical protein
VRVLSAGYDSQANCHFPMALKREGAVYMIPRQHLSTCDSNDHKLYYRVLAQYITEEDTEQIERANNLSMLEVFHEPECVVCMDQESQVIFMPCGHFVCCGDCAIQMPKCPMCSGLIRDWATPQEH